MEEIVINHSSGLKGEVEISGAKNAVLPIMAASILTSGENILRDVPDLTDVLIMQQLLKNLGVKINELEKHVLSLKVDCLNNFVIPYELTSKMRASILLLGPILAKIGKVSISLPGGCAIGSRPIDLHLKGLVAMGANIEKTGGSIIASAGKLHGAKIYLDFPSVGATENLIMAASLADGETIIENAAIEPEIVDLVTFLSSAGAKIQGAVQIL